MRQSAWVFLLFLCSIAGSALPNTAYVLEMRVQRKRLDDALTQSSTMTPSLANPLKTHLVVVPNGVVPVELENHEYYYQITLGIGTPVQDVEFTIDTGSSDLWVVDSINPFCNYSGTLPDSEEAINCTGLTFQSADSTSFRNLTVPFEIQYGDWSAANGTLATDDIRLGDDESAIDIINATFAVAYSANSTNCVFGIGFNQNEANAKIHKNASSAYPLYFNVPTLMKRQGLIKSNSYSLYLNTSSSNTGSILFGGVDHSKYSGSLAVMPMYNYYWKYLEQPTQMRVMLNGVYTVFQGEIEPVASFDIAVLLDSGTSFAYLPAPIVEGVAYKFGYSYSDELGYWYGNCSAATEMVHDLGFNFSGANISVPAVDMLVALKTDDDGRAFTLDGEPQCVLALNVAEDPYGYILGDVILRSMYAVYDLDNYEIGLAQSRNPPDDESSDIEPIIATIPRGSLVPGYTRTSTNSAIYVTGVSTAGSGTQNATAVPYPTSAAVSLHL